MKSILFFSEIDLDKQFDLEDISNKGIPYDSSMRG